VEPSESDGILASLKAKQRVLPSGKGETIMAGLNCGIPSSTAWEIIQNGCDAAMRVTDEDSKMAMRELYFPIGSDARVTAGESGVGGMAGFLAMMKERKFAPLRNHLNIGSHTRVLCYSTEGATDIDLFNRVVQQN
jgi:Threonine dehydratase